MSTSGKLASEEALGGEWACVFVRVGASAGSVSGSSHIAGVRVWLCARGRATAVFCFAAFAQAYTPARARVCFFSGAPELYTQVFTRGTGDRSALGGFCFSRRLRRVCRELHACSSARVRDFPLRRACVGCIDFSGIRCVRVFRRAAFGNGDSARVGYYMRAKVCHGEKTVGVRSGAVLTFAGPM